jgi:hypothetical protein
MRNVRTDYILFSGTAGPKLHDLRTRQLRWHCVVVDYLRARYLIESRHLVCTTVIRRRTPILRKEIQEMTMPGFTAEASLYRPGAHYRGTVTFGQTEGTLQPAQDANCLARCRAACNLSCSGLFGRERAMCIRECRLECLDICSAPPPPPPPPPPPSPCPPGWQWVSGPPNCPTCCRDLGGGLTQCAQPLCTP